ncbi:MAG: TonB-dependent receptor, partial [Myxococcales bacterium]|nr:TonB-dependent receptor [Myxococcales bacterium]
MYTCRATGSLLCYIIAIGWTSSAFAQDPPETESTNKTDNYSSDEGAVGPDIDQSSSAIATNPGSADGLDDAQSDLADETTTVASNSIEPEEPTLPAEQLADVPEDPLPETEDSERLVIVGSRRAVRSVLDSPTPVDSLKASDFNNQGATDVSDLMRSLVPSFNVNTQPISDAATLIRPINLRGLPPDSTVVLVNGKRRHRGSVITFLGAGLNDGSHGTDIAPIPALALERVDVLRDGAAAQYGSDAIAGVINFVLRDDAEGAELWFKLGSYLSENPEDEYAWSVAANVGVPLTEMGFFNLTVEYGHTQPTDRSVQRLDASQLIAGGNQLVGDPAQIWGSPEVSNELKVFANMGIELSENIEMYAFGNVGRRDVLGGFYFRNPNTRDGVYNGGDNTLLVGDLTADGTGNCQNIDVDPASGQPDAAQLQNVIDDDNCFAWNEVLPGGFTPQFGGEVLDLSLAGGLRGTLNSGLRWDVSAVVGSSQTTFKIINTVNASLGPDSPFEFNPGRYRETDQSYNIDLSYPANLDIFYSPLNLSMGFEYRKEVFVVTQGDRASYEIGPLAAQGFGIGSNGFPGFGPNIAGISSRENIGSYLELSTDIVKPWAVQLAARVEDFDTFGTQGTVKASTRFALSDFMGTDSIIQLLAIRGSIGTGYRAPSAGQANVTNVTTNAGADGILRDQGTIPPTNPVAVLKGGKPLEPETSLNITGGLVLKLGKFFDFTADYYYISVDDRIALSANQTLTDDERQALEDSGIAGATGLSVFRFFTNAFDTRTMGLDVVGTSRFSLRDAGALAVSAAYTWNRTKVGDSLPGLIDDTRRIGLEKLLPYHRVVTTVNYFYDALRVMARGNYYGEFSSPEDSPADPDYRF